MFSHLFVVAHADDMELSCLALLESLLSSGNGCIVFVVNNDSKVRNKEQQVTIDYLTSKYGELIKFHKAPRTYANLKIGDKLMELKDELEAIIKENDILVCVSHWGEDTHPDHVAVYRASEIASRFISLVCFESPNSRNFVPNYYKIYAEDTHLMKINLLSEHKTQMRTRDGYFMKFLNSRAQFRGIEVNNQYAEAYRIIRLIKGPSAQRLL